MIRPMRALLLASCCLALTACATAGGPGPRHSGGSGEARIYADVWPQAYADLPPDPAMRFGTLPNGLRYVIMKNATPGGQSSLRLRIGAGSLEETPQQQGLAHLLEHMAFNGSSHVPYGDMIKILERHGLAFGADTNAYTAWEETVYKLDLPKSDDDTVDTSLMLLREIAGELNLDQAIMDKEKGVVLSEERLRDTPNFHMSKQSLGLDLKGQLASDRFPIGKVEAIHAATHAILNDYYRRYYRPERAVLIAVGDFDPNAMEAKIKTQFGGWRGVGPAGGNPDLGEPMKRGSVAKLFVEDGVQPLVNLSWVAPPDLSADSAAKRRREVIERLALAVLNRRLDERVRADNPPFLGAGAYREDVFHSADITTLQTSVKPGAWRPGLDAAIAEQRRLERFGVSPKELADAIDTERASRKATAEGAATRTTPSIADDVVSTLGTPEVETSPAEDLALFEADVKGLTAAEVNATLKTVFGGSGPLVFVSSPEPVEGGDKAVSDAVAADEAAPVTAPVAEASVAWPYDSFGPAGVVADRKEITDLDTVFVRFQNGVRLTIKPTKFRDDQILVEAHIGHGRLDRPADRITTDWAAPGALPEGGLGKLTAQQIDEDLRSRILGHDYSVSDDSFSLSGATRQEDLATQLQLLTAYVSDPGFRPEAFARMKSVIPSYLDQLNASPSGVLSRELGQRLRGGDRRWGLPNAAEVAAETADQFKQEQDGPLGDGPIEVVIVGDITIDKAIEAVAQTFGALPPRADSPAPASAATLTFPAPTPTPVVLTHKGRADQAVGVIAWPTDDFLSDTQLARTLSILSAVLDIRMLDQLRRAEGATYSPYASSQPSSAFPHFGYLAAQVEIPPAKLDGFFKDVAEITADLRTNLVSADELQRARAPAVESLLKRRQTNEYWMTALSGAQDDPRKLAAIRSSEAQLSHVTAEDLRLAAQTYLRDDKAYRLVVKPAGAP